VPVYTRKFRPLENMVVFDVGAHAGLTALELSRMVGPAGKVITFEPDDAACKCLEENLQRNKALNIPVINAAVGEASGAARFNRDGTQAAGLVEGWFTRRRRGSGWCV